MLRDDIQKIFEKHTMPEAGDPELTMFDTEAIILDLQRYTEQRVLDARIELLEQIGKEATTSRVQSASGKGATLITDVVFVSTLAEIDYELEAQRQSLEDKAA